MRWTSTPPLRRLQEQQTLSPRSPYRGASLRTRRHVLTTVIVALTMVFAAACGGSSSADKNSGGPEKSNLKVGVLPTWDAAAIYIAIKKGYFQSEGLKVTPVTVANGDEAVSRTMSGALDISHNGYTTPIVAASKGVKLRVIVYASQAK